MLDSVSEHVPPGRHKRGAVSWLAYLSLTDLSCFVIAVVLLHWLQPELDPLNDAVSYYVHGAHGWLLTVGLLGLGIRSLAFTIGAGRSIDGPAARTAWWLLAIWSVGALLGGIFPTDPPGNWDKPPSVSGLIHGNVALIAFLALPIAALVFVCSLQHDSGWQRKAALLLVIAIATVISLGAFMASLVSVMVSPGPPRLLGLAERILLGV